MPIPIAEQELFRSCEILFGRDINLGHEFLEYLQNTGVKSAYRTKAKETHPDLRAPEHLINRRTAIDEFQSVRDAYENLTRYVDARENGRRFSKSMAQARKANHHGRPGEKTHRHQAAPKARPQSGVPNKKGPIFSRYRGQMPTRGLIFGHFLYYSGIITWIDIVKALAWQRSTRPRIGELAKRLGLLREEDIRQITSNHMSSCHFGESAVRLGLITGKQRKTLLFQQMSIQKKIGDYFIETGTMSPAFLRHHLERFHRHNASFSPPYRPR